MSHHNQWLNQEDFAPPVQQVIEDLFPLTDWTGRFPAVIVISEAKVKLDTNGNFTAYALVENSVHLSERSAIYWMLSNDIPVRCEHDLVRENLQEIDDEYLTGIFDSMLEEEITYLGDGVTISKVPLFKFQTNPGGQKTPWPIGFQG